MAYANNKFCWHGCISTDVEVAKSFYSEVMGWSHVTQQMGDDSVTMLANNGIPRAHLMAPPMPEVPSHWNNYLRVDDIVARTAACGSNAGVVLIPPTDIAPGSYSVVQSPSGAVCCLFHEIDEATAEDAPNDVGGVAWVELNSTDITADIAWLEAALGITYKEMPMPDGGTYYLLESGGESIGAGAMTTPNENVPACWMIWFSVTSVDETLQRAANNGGATVMPPMDMPGVGRLAAISDSTGGVFGIIQGE